MLKLIAPRPPFLVYHETRYELHFVAFLFLLYLEFPCLIHGLKRSGKLSDTGSYTRPPVMVAYSAAGLISASRPNIPAQSQCGHMILIIACSTSFRSVSTLRLVGGHSLIRVKVIFRIASYVACPKAALAAADVMVSFDDTDDSVF